MNEKQPLDYNEEDINNMIDQEMEENINLDYKAMEALSKNESNKKEISKDVSSFTNSDGGIIIYGVKEYDDRDKKHFPEKIDGGYDPSDISKEWLENVINSNIKPKIDGLRINPIQIKGTKKVIYLVYIPKSSTAHQAKDFKYYKRYNFSSVPMEDFEIRDVMNRLKHPLLDPIITQKRLPGHTGELHEHELEIKLVNQGTVLIKNFQFEISMPAQMFEKRSGYFRTERTIKILPDRNSARYTTKLEYLTLYFKNDKKSQVIFPKQEIFLVSSINAERLIRYKVNSEIKRNCLSYNLYWKIYADDMPYREGEKPLMELSNF